MFKRMLFLAVLLVTLTGFGIVYAQDAIPATNLVIWSQDGDANNVVLAEQFQIWADTVSPGSTVEIIQKETEVLRTDLLAAGLAGSGLPDLVLGPNDAVGVFVDAGLLLPLDELFDMSLYPFNLGAAQIAGATYGIPANAGNHLMFLYNKSLVPNAPASFEELVTVAQEVAASNEGVQGFAYNLNEPFWFLPFVHGFGGSVYDAEGNMVLDSEAWVSAFQFVQDLKFVSGAVPQ